MLEFHSLKHVRISSSHHILELHSSTKKKNGTHFTGKNKEEKKAISNNLQKRYNVIWSGIIHGCIFLRCLKDNWLKEDKYWRDFLRLKCLGFNFSSSKTVFVMATILMLEKSD